jgi:hypothetical protein
MNKMSTQIKDGGPAFPHAQRLWDNDAQSWAVHSVGGMTLRDWLASQAEIPWDAVLGTLSIKHPERDKKFTLEEVLKFRAEAKYREADAMLAAREAQL